LKISTKNSCIYSNSNIYLCNIKRVPWKTTHKKIKLPNGKTKAENVFNQLYQNQIALLLLGYRLRLNLYNLANLNQILHIKRSSIGKYERKSKWLSAKQVDRLGKSFGIMGSLIS
jgi:hypothetical protein